MDINFLLGQTLVDVREINNDSVIFTTKEGRRFELYHDQDCCESVYLEDIVGNLAELIDSPILIAEERTDRDSPPGGEYVPESYTWTFYELATIKGSVTLRFFGSSNGYYSESVNFREIEDVHAMLMRRH